MKNTNKKYKIIALAMTSWGILLTGSGITMQLMTPKQTKTVTPEIKISQRKVEKTKSNEIKLKDITLEVNQPLSLNIKDYLTNPNDIENKIIKQLKLDTSMVNTNQAGTYTYTISYKKKKYNGTLLITEKPLPVVERMTLKTLNLKIGSTLSTDIKTYITENVPEEVIANIKLDLSNVNTSTTGNYQYTITYNGKLYTGTITIYEPQEVKTETEKKEEIKDKEVETENNTEKTEIKTEPTTPPVSDTTTEPTTTIQ